MEKSTIDLSGGMSFLVLLLRLLLSCPCCFKTGHELLLCFFS